MKWTQKFLLIQKPSSVQVKFFISLLFWNNAWNLMNFNHFYFGTLYFNMEIGWQARVKGQNCFIKGPNPYQSVGFVLYQSLVFALKNLIAAMCIMNLQFSKWIKSLKMGGFQKWISNWMSSLKVCHHPMYLWFFISSRFVQNGSFWDRLQGPSWIFNLQSAKKP